MTRPSTDLRDAERLGRDRALGEGEQRAGQAGDRAGDDEGDPLQARHVDADRRGAQRRVAAGAQR